MDKEDSHAMIRISDVLVESAVPMGGRDLVLRGVNLEVKEGLIVALVGEVDAGHSILCELVAGLRRRSLRSVSGEILVNGHSTLQKRSVGFRYGVVFMDGNPQDSFNPSYTVERSLKEYTKLLVKRTKRPVSMDWNEAFYAVGIVEPERLLSRKVGDLSMLMLQRIVMMRELLAEARVIVCDEATAKMDRIAESQFIDLIKQVSEERGLTVLFGMRKWRDCECFADEAVVFFEGGILESGNPFELMETPKFQYTAEFLAVSPEVSRRVHELPLVSVEALLEAEIAIGEGMLSPSGE